MSRQKGSLGKNKKQNEYITFGDTSLLYLTKKQIAIIDTDELCKLLPYKWYARYCRFTRSYYANSSCYDNKKVIMHRLIMNTEKHMQVDHINHNTLDNRKINLKNCSNVDNHKNEISHIGNKYRNVFKNNFGFFVRMNIDKVISYFGNFKSEKQAAWASDYIMYVNGFNKNCLNFDHSWKFMIDK
jgi:hypothetical protein